MDAAKLLKSQGWRGKGFSLHPTDNNIGIATPLLLKRTTDGRGIGQKQHHTSDQWWLHAFDEKLKGLDTSKGAVVQSVTKGKLDQVAAKEGSGKWTGASGLYASFVRGGMLEGTLTPESGTTTPATDSDSQTLGWRAREKKEKEERRKRKEAKRLKKEAEEKEARKVEKKTGKKEAKKEKKKEEKKIRRANETKEERKERRAERRAKKEAKRRRRREAEGTAKG
ncbi:hypothetical protein QBC46DRAFT_306902 [Diplogelasinospora grovesii]|uniref:G-patch domain-containing protein n=1 Tax=Diplogelasinospora grovesii TaxID=303347 RepID=A0AAN6S7W0_9PEZI|nr:hypothetical protein QBC46DRAFT_306902 [Diplogelasinospora grovesii]